MMLVIFATASGVLIVGVSMLVSLFGRPALSPSTGKHAASTGRHASTGNVAAYFLSSRVIERAGGAPQRHYGPPPSRSRRPRPYPRPYPQGEDQ